MHTLQHITESFPYIVNNIFSRCFHLNKSLFLWSDETIMNIHVNRTNRQLTELKHKWK